MTKQKEIDYKSKYFPLFLFDRFDPVSYSTRLYSRDDTSYLTLTDAGEISLYTAALQQDRTRDFKSIFVESQDSDHVISVTIDYRSDLIYLSDNL